jgi:hypothetical protein
MSHNWNASYKQGAPTEPSALQSCHYRISHLEKFQLLHRFRRFNLLSSPEYFHHPKLFIGHAHNAYMSFWGQNFLYPFNMNIGIFPAAAMPYVHAELEHAKPVSHDLLAEFGVILPVLFGFSRQIKKYKYPHDAICIKAFKHGPLQPLPSGEACHPQFSPEEMLL